MTRFILTSATLAACLTAGVPLATPSPLPLRADRSSRTAELSDDHAELTIGGHLLALHVAGSVTANAALGVSLILQPDQPMPDSIRLWAGRKNGWGSQSARAEAVPGCSGLLVATVAIPDPLPPLARLWVSVEPNVGRPMRGSVPLTSV